MQEFPSKHLLARVLYVIHSLLTPLSTAAKIRLPNYEETIICDVVQQYLRESYSFDLSKCLLCPSIHGWAKMPDWFHLCRNITWYIPVLVALPISLWFLYCKRQQHLVQRETFGYSSIFLPRQVIHWMVDWNRSFGNHHWTSCVLQYNWRLCLIKPSPFWIT